MRVAYIVPSLSKQGPVVVVFELARLLTERGHDVIVFYFDDKTVNVLQFPCKTARISFFKKIDFNRFDVVHTHGFRPDAYVFLHRSRMATPCFVSTIHNFVMKDFSAQYNKLTAFVFGNLWMALLHRHDMRVVLSLAAKEYYLHWFEARQLEVVYNTRFVDIHRKLSSLEESELIKFRGQGPLLGVNAMLTPRKGIDLILRSMPFIEDARLFIVGDGKSRSDLQKLSVDLGVSDRVYFAGYHEDAYRYIPYYDLYLLPSRSEGFPLAMLEAVVMKKNIVCSDIPVFKEIFTSDEVTFFELENVSSLVAAVGEALERDKTTNAYSRYLREYSPEKFIDGYLRIYTNT